MAPPLGFIEPVNRTRVQEAAHIAAMSSPVFVRHALMPKQMAKGQAVRLFDHWKNPEVVADLQEGGFKPFTRWHQNTGSCVKAGGFNAAIATIAAQRVAGENPTKAFVPFMWHNYARSRELMGDTGQGEGSMGSTFAQSCKEDGLRDYPANPSDYMPDYQHSIEDGYQISSQLELKWSSVRNADYSKAKADSTGHTFGAATEATSTNDILALVQNGYGVTFACNNYINSGRVRGSGANAAVCGRWDTRGGHQQSILGVWENPELGLLFWAQNNWYADQYPADPAGGPLCGCWVTEADVSAALRLDAEVYGLGLLSWFPAQPKLLDWDM